MRQAPLRQGVRRETLVEYDDRGLQARILQVRIELRQELRHHHALVDDGVRGQGGHIEHGVLRLELLFAAPARKEQSTVEGGGVDIAGRVDKDLHDRRHGLQRLLPTGARIRRHHAKTRDGQFLLLQLAGQDFPGMGGHCRILVQEHESGAKQRCEPKSCLGGRAAQEQRRHLQEQPAAIARLAIGRDRAAMRQAIQGADCRLQQPVAGHIVQVRNQAETAGVLLVGLPVKAPILGARIRAVFKARALPRNSVLATVYHSIARTAPCPTGSFRKALQSIDLSVRGANASTRA